MLTHSISAPLPVVNSLSAPRPIASVIPAVPSTGQHCSFVDRMYLEHTRRQVAIDPYIGGLSTSSSSLFYWREWAIFAGAILIIILSIALLRRNGRQRIASQRKLLPIQKYLFPRMYRNGPPYADPPVAMTSTYAQFRANFTHGNMPAPPPPSYDPYVQNLPAYQAKTDTTVGTGEAPSEHNEPPRDEYRYTIPETGR